MESIYIQKCQFSRNVGKSCVIMCKFPNMFDRVDEKLFTTFYDACYVNEKETILCESILIHGKNYDENIKFIVFYVNKHKEIIKISVLKDKSELMF